MTDWTQPGWCMLAPNRETPGKRPFPRCSKRASVVVGNLHVCSDHLPVLEQALERLVDQGGRPAHSVLLRADRWATETIVRLRAENRSLRQQMHTLSCEERQELEELRSEVEYQRMSIKLSDKRREELAAKPVVTYYVRRGDWIKIGMTRDLRGRLQSLRGAVEMPDDGGLILLGVEHANVERVRHRQFAHLRGVGEWFRADAELLTFIEMTASAEQVAS